MTPIDTATNTAGTAITVGSAPVGVAVTPDQGPAAGFSATVAPAGQASSFDASASSDPDGTVSSYHWDFGDGTSQTTTSTTTTHTYATANAYTVTLTVTDDAGCSTALVFTGQTAYCNASAAARSTRSITVPPAVTVPPATVAVPRVDCAGHDDLKPARIAAQALGRRAQGQRQVRQADPQEQFDQALPAGDQAEGQLHAQPRRDRHVHNQTGSPRAQGQRQVRQADREQQAQAELREGDRRPRTARQDRKRRR